MFAMSQIVPVVCFPPSGGVPQNLPHSASTDPTSNEASLKSRLPLHTTAFVEGGDSRKRTKKQNRKLKMKPSKFGAFQKLPADVRLNIWHYLMPEERDDSECAREPYGS